MAKLRPGKDDCELGERTDTSAMPAFTHARTAMSYVIVSSIAVERKRLRARWLRKEINNVLGSTQTNLISTIVIATGCDWWAWRVSNPLESLWTPDLQSGRSPWPVTRPWYGEGESNPQQAVSETAASAKLRHPRVVRGAGVEPATTRLSTSCVCLLRHPRALRVVLVRGGGFEPPTHGV